MWVKISHLACSLRTCRVSISMLSLETWPDLIPIKKHRPWYSPAFWSYLTWFLKAHHLTASMWLPLGCLQFHHPVIGVKSNTLRWTEAVACYWYAESHNLLRRLRWSEWMSQQRQNARDSPQVFKSNLQHSSCGCNGRRHHWQQNSIHMYYRFYCMRFFSNTPALTWAIMTSSEEIIRHKSVSKLLFKVFRKIMPQPSQKLQ